MTTLYQGLKLYLPFNSANLTKDFAGGGSFTNVGSMGTTTGIIGDAIAPDGTAKYLTRDTSPHTEVGGKDWTISVWVKLADLNTTRGVLGKFSGTASTSEYLIWYSGGAKVFRTNLYDGSGTEQVDYFTLTPAADTWYQIVFTFDATIGQGFMQVNTTSAEGARVGTATGESVQTRTNNFVIGNFGHGSNIWNGVIDEVSLWHRVLTASEITENWNSGAATDLSGIENHLNRRKLSHFTLQPH